jgi:hypothetical protein
MNEESPRAPRGTPSPWLELSKNPLLILLLGTALGSIIVPQLDQHIARSRQLQSLRTQKAISIIKSDNDTDAALTAIQTLFENRGKDDSTILTWKENLPSFRSRLYSLHEDFDHVAWRWCPENVKEAYLLGLIDGASFDRGRTICSRYESSLRWEADERDLAWKLLLTARQSPVTSDEVDGLRVAVARASAALTQSRKDREAMVSELVHIVLGQDGFLL